MLTMTNTNDFTHSKITQFYTNKITINLNQIKNIFEAVSNKLDATLCIRCQSLTGMCSVLAHPPAVNV